MTCTATLWQGVLTCTREEPHVRGHIFGATEPGDTHYEPAGDDQ